MAPRSLAGFVDRLDAWQQKRRAPGFAVAVGLKYREDRGRQYAALLSYYGFISMFPLLLLFVWILGVFLKDSPSLREKILDSIIARLPVLGAQITRDADSLHLNGFTVVVGVVTLLWAGLKVVRTTQDAFNEQWGVPWLAAARPREQVAPRRRDARDHRRRDRRGHRRHEPVRVQRRPCRRRPGSGARSSRSP